MQSPLFRRIYETISRIPKGKVATYGQIAALAGNPRAARVVGWVLHGAHDHDLPWHRVINAQGQSSFPLEAKRNLQQALLEAEGVRFDGQAVDLELFQWHGR